MCQFCLFISRVLFQLFSRLIISFLVEEKRKIFVLGKIIKFLCFFSSYVFIYFYVYFQGSLAIVLQVEIWGSFVVFLVKNKPVAAERPLHGPPEAPAIYQGDVAGIVKKALENFCPVNVSQSWIRSWIFD